MRNWFWAVAAMVCATWVWAAEALPVAIKPDDPRLCYAGRMDTSDPAGPRFSWSHSGVAIHFRGTDLQVKLSEGGDNYYELVIDNAKNVVVHPEKGTSVIDLARGLGNGEHEVYFIKRTEAHVGVVQFLGFYVNQGGDLLKTKKPARRIEVIGDSISCGYGNESANEKVKFNTKDENAFWTYGSVAARELDADYMCVAWSGRKMWPNNTMPEIYDRAIATDPTSTWDFTRWQADVVVINLATNDFSGGAPDEAQWTAAYKTFIKRVRSNYPKAMIYIASGSMMSDAWPPQKKVLSTLKRYLQRIQDELKAEGETRVRQIHFAPQNGQADGLGGDWHPSVKTQVKMGRKLIETIKTDLGWDEIRDRVAGQ